MLDFEAIDNVRGHDSTLGEIMHLVDMPFGVTAEGWTGESARLFAIDIAVMAVRRNVDILTESDRQRLSNKLQQARTLVVGRRDSELGFIQANLEAHLPITAPGRRRQIWLIAIDALLPSPHRAALVTTKNGLTLDTTDAFAELSTLLRERLLARLDEGSLDTEPPTFFRIA